jgi:hypothetical protein
MNILRRIYERIVDKLTGTELVHVDLSQEEREVLEGVSELSGVKSSTVMRVIFAEAMIKKEGLAAIQALIRESSASRGAS